MDANKFKEQLTINDIYNLMSSLDANPYIRGNVMYCVSICHNGDGHNLRYYADTYSFYCFSNCGAMSVYDVVSKIIDKDFFNSFKYVLNYFNYSISDISFNNASYEDKIDLSFFDRDNKIEEIKLRALNENILNNYYDQYYKGWINEGINIDTMKLFNIKNSIVDKQIIIPHYDMYNNLVGVRVRNLDKELVNSGKKYMPAYLNNKLLNHPTGSILYGLNINKETIEKNKKIILFESEKSVMKLHSYDKDLSIGVCLSGSSLTNRQIEILKTLNINEVIIGVDKEFDNIGTNDEKLYAKKIQESIVDKISIFWNVTILWDVNNLLDVQDSPVDKTPEVFNELYKNRILLN